jgi:thiamine pyrophosphokinase
MAAEAQQPEVKTTSPAPEPAPAPAESDKTDFEKAQERYGSAYAILADGLKGEGVDKTVKIVQYALAAAAVFVILAAIYSSL